MPKRYWKSTSQKNKGLIVNFYEKFSLRKASCLLFLLLLLLLFFFMKREQFVILYLLTLNNQNVRIENVSQACMCVVIL